jgi:hypothetical protein
MATGRIPVISVDGGNGAIGRHIRFRQGERVRTHHLQALRIAARFLKIAGAD